MVTNEIPEVLEQALSSAYRLEAVIGRGGMATVYRASDLRHGRQVAIKVMRDDLASAGDFADRFLREVRFTARLVHPHILPIHDSGQAAGLLYCVLPFLSGESLAQRIRRLGKLPIEDAVKITRAVASALDYAHRQGIVHRDIKPENILLVDDHPVVADFGVARALSDVRDGRLTGPGGAIGTPTYMSPEQASGEVEVDGRSDQYSLACVLYEMLTGKPPFPDLPVRATLVQHMTRAPSPVSQSRPTVPEPQEKAITRALAKDPNDRFGTIAEFAEALGASPMVSAPPAILEASRNARGIAVLDLANLSTEPGDEYLSNGIVDELTTMLSQIEGLHVPSRLSVSSHADRPDVRTIGEALNVAYVLQGTMRRSGPRIRVTAQLTDTMSGRLLWSGRYDRKMEDVFELEEELARTIVGTLRGLLLGELADPTPKRYTENPRAYQAYLKGRHAWGQRTQAGLYEGIQYFEQAIAEDPGYALAYTGLADCYAMQIDYRGLPVQEGMKRAKVEAQRALALDEELAEAHTSLAWVTFIYDWEWAGAEAEFRRAIEINPKYATARQWYSWLLVAMGRIAEGITQARTAAALEPASVSIQRSLGWILHVARRPDEAVAQLRRSLVLDPTAEDTHRVLGMVHLDQLHLAQAAASFEEALSLSPESSYSLAGLGAVHAVAGRDAEVQDVLRQLEAREATGYVSPVAFAMVAAARRDADDLFRWLERALEDRRGWLAYLKVEPLLDPFRGDPRYGDWLDRMRLV